MQLVKNMQKFQRLGQYSFSTAQQSYYQVLGISQTATSQQIYEAYTQLAAQQVPFVNSASEQQLTSEQGASFRQIAEAYAVLSHQESRNNYDLLNEKQPDRIYSEVKARQQKYYSERGVDGQLRREPHAKGSYAEERTQQLAEERAKFNVDFLGRYKGGLPQKGRGNVRGSIHGSALAPPGGHHDVLVHNEKTDQFPEAQVITNEMANDFSAYQNQSRYEVERRWPAFQAKVDYDYFKFNDFKQGLRYLRNILIFFLGIPGLAAIFARWRNAYALHQYRAHGAAQALGQNIVVGKSGAVKFA